MLVFVYGFNLWTLFLSFTNSKAFADRPRSSASRNYQKLWTWTFETDPPSSWYTAIVNMGLFGGLYVVFCLILGLTLAILLDQKIRGEGILRPIYLYPLALSFIVTGTAWKLFLDPGIGLEKAVHDLGLDELQVRLGRQPAHDDLLRRDRRHLADLRLRHGDVPGGPARHRRRNPQGRADRRRLGLRHLSAHRHSDHAAGVPLGADHSRPIMAIKSYDLVLSVTGKNPGGAAELPSTFMYSYTFTRNQMAVGSTSAVIMLMTIAAIMVPYLYSELQGEAPMSAADLVTAAPGREPARHSDDDARRHLRAARSSSRSSISCRSSSW